MMNSRRKFLQQTGAFIAASVIAPRLLTAQTYVSRPLGLQLFTLFGQIEKDVKGSLQKVADAGYKEIESAFSMLPAFYGMSGKEFSSYLSSIGMTWTSHHAIGAPLKPRPGFDFSKMPKMLSLKNDTNEIIDSLAGTGVKYLVCANIPIESKKEIEEAVVILNRSGEAAKKAGLVFCYHNHDAEFKSVEGVLPFDVFAKDVPSDLLKFELDLGWVSKAGIDPVELFKKHPGRFPLCHIKDFNKDYSEILPVGEGIIDYATIFKSASLGGLEHFFVEHDMPKNPYESIAISMQALKKIL
ncbi:sugar phosphate isomerase/epimerase family protein [Aquirufa sp. ROCK2-A2]